MSQTGEYNKTRGALELTDIVMGECPVPEHLAAVYQVRADCFETLGDLDSAARAWRECVWAEEEGHAIKVDAALHFAGFVVRYAMTAFYEEAFACLAPGPSMVFPARQFEAAAIFAILFHHRCMFRRARKWAG